MTINCCRWTHPETTISKNVSSGGTDLMPEVYRRRRPTSRDCPDCPLRGRRPLGPTCDAAQLDASVARGDPSHEARIGQLEQELSLLARQSPACQVLTSVPGIGLLTSTAMIAAIGDP
jgi:transposase